MIFGVEKHRESGAHRNDFREPILIVLYRNKGRMRCRFLLDEVGNIASKYLTSDDHATIASTLEPRWRNDARWKRQTLIDEGYLKPNFLRGIWELTDMGAKFIGDKIT